METIQFVLGLLTMVSITLVVGIVVGMLKISKLTNQISDLSLKLDREADNIYREMQKEHQSIWQQFEDVGRDTTMVERTLSQLIDREVSEAHRHIDDEVKSIQHVEEQLENAIYREIEKTKQYVDSRIDKTILSGSMKSSKQRING